MANGWETGRIPGGARRGAWAMGLFALVWNALTWPIAWLFLTQKAGEPVAYFVMVFPGAGVLLLALGVRSALQVRKHGTSTLVLDTNPGVVGRTLEGNVETSLAEVPTAGVEVRFRCVRRRVTRHGNKQSTNMSTIWQDHVTIDAADLTRGITGLRIPIAFEIPDDALPHDDSNPSDTVTWHLEVSAEVPGVDYGDSFDVPVFATGAPPLTAEEREAFREKRVARARSYVPARPIFTTRATALGGTELSFAQERSVASAIGVVVLSALFWAAAVWLYRIGVPIAPWIVGVLALFVTAGMFVALFHRSSVTVEGGRVTIRHRILGLGTTRSFAATEISDVRSEVVGEGNAQSWEVTVRIDGGGNFSAAAHLASQRDADWTAEQLRAVIAAARG